MEIAFRSTSYHISSELSASMHAAESGEGRLRIKENTLAFDTYPTLSGSACVPRMGSVRRSIMLARYSS
jgi:hypothetical protein